MEYGEYCDAIRREGHALGDAAARAPASTRTVPSCPEWKVADLLGHVGRLHRWVARDRRVAAATTRRDHWSDAEPPPADERLDWFDGGVDLVADALLARRAATPSVVVDRPTRTAGFWARRQANETAVHRWDAQTAAGATEPIEHALAVDGIDEFFGLIPFWQRRIDAARRGRVDPPPLHRRRRRVARAARAPTA